MADQNETGDFKILVKPEAGSHVVEIHGTLAEETKSRAKETFLGLLDSSPARIVVDLTGLDYISSAGIGLLISVLRHCRQRLTPLAVCGLGPEIEELFKLTHLDQVFNVFRNRPEALRRLA